MKNAVGGFGWGLWFAILAAAFVFGACSSEPQPDTSPTVSPGTKKRAIPQPKEEKRSEDVFGLLAGKFEYSYNPIGKKDPFRMDIERGEDRFPGNSRLLEFSIDQLKVTAIIWGISKPRALIQTPDGENFIVKKGELVGRNYGKIDRIQKEEIVVIEEYPGPLGKLIVNEIVMPLEDETERGRG